LAFWRSASFLLAATLETAFRFEHAVHLLCNWHTVPEQGSVVCDIAFTPSVSKRPHQKSHTLWIPSRRELDALSAHGQRLASLMADFVPLQDAGNDQLFDACFADRSLRFDRLRSEFGADDHTPVTTFYRMGSFVEACRNGPLVSSTRMVGRFAVTRFVALGWLRGHLPSDDFPTGIVVYRVHGTALPSAFPTHFTTFDRLVRWSREPNEGVPQQPDYVVPF
uniref:DUF2236 domain-containing protein n=1 Tax=Echinostoma caproni TaxID=27848 RepID=A0A183B2A5_9TREM